jgi:ankyrin repeat protein
MFKFFKNRKNMALLDAVIADDPKKIRKLLDKGADVNAKDGHEYTALSSASDDGHTQIVKALLEAGADVNAKDGYENTALSLASNEGYREIVKALLEAGADVNVKNIHGDTALIQASDEGHTEIVKTLLDAGAIGEPKGVTKMSVTSLAAEFHELRPQYVFEVTGEQLSAGQPVNQEEVARISVNRAGEVLMRKYGLSAAEVAKVVELSASTVPDD